jgi:YVTN family beta-propeller protein
LAGSALAGLLALALIGGSAGAVPVEVLYRDAPGTGFFDAERGAARRAALEFAAAKWAEMLEGEIPIVVDAEMMPLGGAGVNALLAFGGAATVQRNFSGARPDTWYGAALANQLARTDLNGPDRAEITVTFNADVDGPEVLGSVNWYYGLDARPGADIDFVTIALHELGHGLGFFETVDAGSGGWRQGGDPGIFDRLLFRPGVGGFADMRASERLAAIVAGGRLLFAGPHLVSVAPPAAVHAPDPFQQGSSIAHWDESFSPDELMVPSYAGPNHDPGLLLPALADMGWRLAAASISPAPTWTPAPTVTPRPRLTATPAAGDLPLVVLATNFDAATVSFIDVPPNRVTATIPVGDGPIGITISADGSTAYVANFHSASVSVISTIERRVVDTIAVQGSANGVALSPDGSLLFATDTFTGTVAVIDTAARALIHIVPAPPQPAGVAVAADSRAFVANFGADFVSVVDPSLGEVVAKIPLDPFEARGPLAVAIARDGDVGYVTTAFSDRLLKIDTLGLASLRGARIFSGAAEAVVLNADGTVAYLAATDANNGNGVVKIVDLATNEITRTIRVGDNPEAAALIPEGTRLYVANTGSDTLSFFNPQAGFILVGSIPVGAAPMGVAAARIAPTSTARPTASFTATPTATPHPTASFTATPTGTARPEPCPGDCDSSGEVTIEELVRGVAIALGRLAAETCPALDADGSGLITIDEVLQAVRSSMEGCA